MFLAIPKRYFVAILAYFCLTFLFLLQRMQNDIDYYYTNIQNKADDSDITHLICAVFSFPGGILATRYGGSLLFGIATALSAILNIWTREIVNLGGRWYEVVRYGDRMLPELAYCALLDVWGRWAPKEERSKLSIFSFCGIYFSKVMFGKLDSIIPKSLDRKFHFYLIGSITLLLSYIWLYFTKNDPTLDRSLSREERQKSTDSADIHDWQRHNLNTYPWKSIFTSKPLWAICIVELIRSRNAIISTDSTLFASRQFIVDSQVISLSYLLYFLIIGYGADQKRLPKRYSSTQIREFCILFGLFIGALSTAYLILIPQNQDFQKVYFFILPSQAFIEAGVLVNIIDISPRYSGTLFGFVSSITSIRSLLSSKFLNLANMMTIDFQIFLFAVFMAGIAMYYLWGSAKLQPWNATRKEEYELRKIEGQP